MCDAPGPLPWTSGVRVQTVRLHAKNPAGAIARESSSQGVRGARRGSRALRWRLPTVALRRPSMGTRRSRCVSGSASGVLGGFRQYGWCFGKSTRTKISFTGFLVVESLEVKDKNLNPFFIRKGVTSLNAKREIAFCGR